MVTIYALYTLQVVALSATRYSNLREIEQKQEYRLTGEFLGKERCEQAAKELGLTYRCLDTGRTR